MSHEIKTGHTAESLRAFEAQIAADFDAARIRAPVHLAGGNEEHLIKIFQAVREQDWVLTQWRSHYHCLLKGVPPDQLRADILAGRSISLCYPEHRIISSAIVGGVLPIAVGLALSIKRRREAALERANYAYDSHLDAIEQGDIEAQQHSYDNMVAEGGVLSELSEEVWCFVGDMTAHIGAFHESVKYASNHDLPVLFVVEDNGKSVCSDTSQVWGAESLQRTTRYAYDLPWPHAGAGKRVQF